jgi:hypothetical protein
VDEPFRSDFFGVLASPAEAATILQEINYLLTELLATSSVANPDCAPEIASRFVESHDAAFTGRGIPPRIPQVSTTEQAKYLLDNAIKQQAEIIRKVPELSNHSSITQEAKNLVETGVFRHLPGSPYTYR